MTRIARLLAILVISACIISLGTLSIGAVAPHQADSESSNPPAAEAESETSVSCLPFGLYGAITAEALVASLSDISDNLTFLGTSNGLYVVGPDGKLRHFLYSPFGVHFVALIDDITGDGTREVVVVLNDTQVPALRCYDGATWEKLWQFAPMARIWDRLWVKRQLSITSLEVISTRSSQSVVLTSGRCVFSVDAKDGQRDWRFSASSALGKMATVADLNGDGADEVFTGTADGHLFLLNGKTGQVKWRTRLPEITVYNETIQSTAEHILTLDREAGLVAVASRDSSVRLFDLKGKRVEREVFFPTQDAISPGPMSLVPNATSDGQPGILVSYASPSPSASGMGTEAKNRVALLDAAGNELWDREINAWGLDTGSYGGQPIVIVPTAEEIDLIDLADGETVVKTIPVSTLDGQAPMVQQVGETRFLLFSSGGDLAVVSDSGVALWNHPRVTNVKVKSGHFVGDAMEDTLFSAECESTSQYGYLPLIKNDGVTLVTPGNTYSPDVPEPEIRLLKVMDGATGEIAWSYEVPLTVLKSSGGLKGIEVTADLVGNDGVQDIIGYREDTVFVFSGKDGPTPFSFSVGQPIASLDVIRNGASDNAIAVSIAGGLSIFDSSDTPLWTTTSAEWVEDEDSSFMVLDDVNSDNVSDLAILSPSKIVLLESTGSATAYQSHLTFNAETGSLIEYVEVVPDANGDGVRELAYIQRNPGSQQPGQSTPPGCPALVKRSPVGGEQLLRVALPGRYPAIDLACGDFDGDGCADSLICCNSYDTCGSTPSDPRSYVQNPGLELRIISGRDGATIRTHGVNSQSYAGSRWNISPPATNIGDVTGDGKDDLAWTGVSGSQAYSGYCHQQSISVYDVARDQSLKAVPATSLLREGGGYSSGESATLLPADIDGDGRSEVLAAVSEPSMTSFGGGPYQYYTGGGSTQYLAVVDVDSGQRLAGFTGFNPATLSLFETHRPGILGVAAGGGAYYLNTDASLQVTSPADGARTGPTVGVRWEVTSEEDFVQVFVDGVCNHTGNGSGVDLYLARGDHDVVVRSIDDYGRISYGPSDLSAPVSIKVTPSPWKPVLLTLSLFVLAAFFVLLFYARLHRVLRARRRAARQQAEHA